MYKVLKLDVLIRLVPLGTVPIHLLDETADRIVGQTRATPGLRDDPEIEEVALDAAGRMRSFRIELGAPTTYASRCVRSAAADFFRRSGRCVTGQDLDQLPARDRARPRLTDDDLELIETWREKTRRFLTQLSDRDRWLASCTGFGTPLSSAAIRRLPASEMDVYLLGIPRGKLCHKAKRRGKELARLWGVHPSQITRHQQRIHRRLASFLFPEGLNSLRS